VNMINRIIEFVREGFNFAIPSPSAEESFLKKVSSVRSSDWN
jgi:hypothetical protein